MGMDDMCAPGLILGLGFPPSSLETLPKTVDKSKPASNGFDLEPCLTLSLSGKISKGRTLFDMNKVSSFEEESGGWVDSHQRRAVSSPLSGVSSFSTAKAVVVKREREASSDDAEFERVSSKASDEEDDLGGGGGGSNSRKKLRLSKDQSALLEESFKQHSTLNPKQKQIIARQLNLLPRQVEVWFQNRRARTKLKQTEVDCELLKKCCKTLSDDNRRLQKELQELKSLKLAQPFYMHVPAAATLTMCPSCERVCSGGDNKSPKSPFSMAPTTTTKPQFYAARHQFTNPSAAC